MRIRAHLWEVLLCQKVPCVLCVLWAISLRCSSCSGSRQRRAETTGFRRQRGYGRMPYPPNLCASVPICGRCFSARRFCVFRAFCGRYPCLFCWYSSCSGRRQSRADTTGFCWLRGYGRMPYPPNLCASVPIRVRYFSARRFCAFRGFCGRCFSARRFCVFRAFCGIYPCLFCWCSSCSDRRQSRAKTTGFRRQRGYGRMPYPPNLCASVPICGRYFSARRFRVFRAFCGRFFSTRRVRSVGGTSQPEE